MKKIIYFSFVGLSIFAASCKEYVDAPIPKGEILWSDSTYTDAIATPQSKYVLVDELSGVKCVNCPAGAEKLKELAITNKIIAVATHTGPLTSPILNYSIQDLRTDQGDNLLPLIFKGASPAKPAAAFDRLELNTVSNQINKWFVEGYNRWVDALSQAQTASAGKTPVNVEIKTTAMDSKGYYGIEVAVKYTEAVQGKQALHIYLTESGIVDWQEFSGSKKEEYTFDHVFRGALTSIATGAAILDDMTTKEAGRVYVYKSKFKIDTNDVKQKFWNPAKMNVVAFVSNANDGKINVLQVQETHL